MSISVGGHQVVVEASGPLDVVAAKALEVWNATDSPDARLSSEPMGFGLTAQISDPVTDESFEVQESDPAVWTMGQQR